MIDKDRVERAAIQQCAMKPILCHFHVQRVLEQQIQKVFTDKQAQNKFWTLFLQASRCDSEKQLQGI